MAGEKIARMLKDSKGHEQNFSDIVYGRVISTSPLQVEVEGRFRIGRDHLVLSRTVQDLFIEFQVPTYSANTNSIPIVPVSDGKVDVDADVTNRSVVTGITEGTRTVQVQVFRDLRVNDRVSMIRARKGQIYYILDRR